MYGVGKLGEGRGVKSKQCKEQQIVYKCSSKLSKPNKLVPP